MDEMDNVLGLELALDAQYIDQLEAENKRLRDALVRLVNESIHFKNTKFGDRHLLAAIDQANQALEQ
jgi:hypothetical protein